MKPVKSLGFLVLTAAVLNAGVPCGNATAQFAQLGGKLVGTGAVGTLVYQGMAAAISSDGNTAISGASRDNSGIGATWVFTKNGSAWTQQGNKLVGSGGAGTTLAQGAAVALSADGNTAIVGGYGDNSEAGAAWIFVRNGTTWSQQGPKLVGSGGVSFMRQGGAVAISGDGNTVAIGGAYDNAYKGATWVFTRTGTTWSQQGSKLVGTGGTATSFQGASVALSADGNTLLEGGSGDAGAIGSAWVFTRSGGVWTQQGAKLQGSGYTGAANQGSSVSISADGNTALIGATGDNSYVGAVWVFTRSGSTWTQQGTKLVGTGAVGIAEQGWSVALSGTGNTAVIGGYRDNNYVGALWIFTRSGGVWTQQGSKLVGTGAVGGAQQAKMVSVSGDGKTIISGGPIDNGGAGAAWIFFNPATDVRQVSETPGTFRLNQNYPNPFNPSTIVSFQIPEASDVRLVVYDMLGQEIQTLVNERKPAGAYESHFTASGLSSGVYLLRLTAGDRIQSQKMTLVK